MNQSWHCRLNRYYDPATDQLLSIDPDVSRTDQPYEFTNDDPLNSEDPQGLLADAYPGVGTGNTLQKLPPYPQNEILFINSVKFSDGNFRKMNKWEIDEYKLDPHEIKIDIYGRNPSKYDIFINKDNGEIMTGPKNPGPNTEMEPTGFRVVDGKISEGFTLKDFGIGSGDDDGIEGVDW